VKAGVPGDEWFEPESIDVVTMWHALEHTADPGRFLDQAWKWGRGEDWDLPYHLDHFTPATLTAMISRCGFRTLRSKAYHSDYVKGKLRKIPVVGLLARPIAKFFSGTGYAVVAGKTARPHGGGANAAAK
jgi:hypothetical protein